VKAEGATVDDETLKEQLLSAIREEYPKWWAPDDVIYIEAVPKTATGKFDKKVLREQYGDESLIEGKAPEQKE